jgi:hypothetical protein
VGGSCTFTENGFTNRTITVTENTTLANVCWQSCEACVTDVNNVVTNSFNIYPNPAKNELNISGINAGQKIVVRNMLGQCIGMHNASGNLLQIALSDLESGFYFISIEKEGEITQTQTFVVE